MNGVELENDLFGHPSTSFLSMTRFIITADRALYKQFHQKASVICNRKSNMKTYIAFVVFFFVALANASPVPDHPLPSYRSVSDLSQN